MSESTLNPFLVLEVSEDADLETIKAAYHRLVKRWHPDQFTDSTEQEIAQTRLVQLNLAYQEAVKAAGRRTPHVTPDLPLPMKRFSSCAMSCAPEGTCVACVEPPLMS